ncbi:MAG: hypothetical protein PW947_20725 [Paraburkholderia sp.]|nr:hypothetical protein [Paraburkholderia sp.]MDE1182860.1 hypothetical protein [Paraburkholderia sp.]
MVALHAHAPEPVDPPTPTPTPGPAPQPAPQPDTIPDPTREPTDPDTPSIGDPPVQPGETPHSATLSALIRPRYLH